MIHASRRAAAAGCARMSPATPMCAPCRARGRRVSPLLTAPSLKAPRFSADGPPRPRPVPPAGAIGAIAPRHGATSPQQNPGGRERPAPTADRPVLPRRLSRDITPRARPRCAPALSRNKTRIWRGKHPNPLPARVNTLPAHQSKPNPRVGPHVKRRFSPTSTRSSPSSEATSRSFDGLALIFARFAVRVPAA